jgi:hypothetical protein
MKIPSRKQAEFYLSEASEMNPGPWTKHVQQVAKTAENIAQQHPEIETEPAYIFGLLHDIGRREGVHGMRHIVDGYRFLMDEGYPDAARICLTHSYPIPNVMAGSSDWDGTKEEQEFVSDYLEHHPYDIYDQLIQLCDSLCMSTGPVLMEKRLLDVVLRYGFNDFTIPKWKAYFQIFDEFESTIGRSIYGILPGVVENTFKDSA